MLWASVHGGKLLLFSGDSQFTLSLHPSLQVEAGRATSIGHFRQLAVLGNGTVLTAYVDRSPQFAGKPLKVFATSGALRKAFGADDDYFRLDSADALRRVIAPSNDGGFWVAWAHEYRVEKWDSTMVKRSEFVRAAPWFRGLQLPGPVSPSDAPRPVIMSVREDAAGRLWVVSVAASPNWARYLRKRDLNSQSYAIEPLDSAYDSVVDVIDPTHARLVASARVRGFAVAQTKEGELLTQRFLPDGAFVLEEIVVSLQVPRPQ
jgi:hypothetical protein